MDTSKKTTKKPKLEVQAVEQTPAEEIQTEQRPAPEAVMTPAAVEVISDPADSIVLKPYHVLFIEVNKSGEEVPGTEFQIHQRSMNKKPWNDTEKFKLKKSEQ